MEGRGPYRIYDPGGCTQKEAFEQLVEENNKLKEKMQGIKSLGNGEDDMETEKCTVLIVLSFGIPVCLCVIALQKNCFQLEQTTQVQLH